MKIEINQDEVTCAIIISAIILGMFLIFAGTAVHKVLDNEAAKYKVEKEAPRD